MTQVGNLSWLLNQEGLQYPAEIARGQHYDSTSGGNGVGSPRAAKVVASDAADNKVHVLPGGITAVSTFAGAENQSYYALNDRRQTLEISPTGPSSGRTDLMICRFTDNQYESHPYDDRANVEDLDAETAKLIDWWWFEILEGQDSTTQLSYPHVKLAEWWLPPNRTWVDDDDITDIRELADPKNDLHMRSNNMITPDTQSLHSGSTVWPTDATHTMKIPEYATRVHIWGNWASVLANASSTSEGIVVIALVHPDGSEIRTQQSRWRNVRTGSSSETLDIMLGDNRPVPEKFRGQTVRVEMRGTKTRGPNVYMDGNSSWKVELYFEQEIA